MFQKPLTGTATDYSKKEHWLVRTDNPDKAVDMIYLYPSRCMDPEADIICTIDNPSMAETARHYYSSQATAFEPVANMFAPFWRQVNGVKLQMMRYEDVHKCHSKNTGL